MSRSDPRAAALSTIASSDSTPSMGVLQEAGFVSRFTAFVFDVVIVSLSGMAFAALVSLILGFFGFSAEALNQGAATSDLRALLQLIIVGLSWLAVFLFFPAYFISFWALVGVTPGKRILGLRVLRPDGQHISWARAIIRYGGYWIAALPLFLGFLWILVDARRQGWHDKIAGTIVVYTWDVLETERVQHASNTDLRREQRPR
jgi:uncharacterized RDD family membrane protein YckC